jgi:hypothetical protein
MQKVQVTNEQVILFSQSAEAYLSKHPERNSFTHALSRVLKGIRGVLDDYNDELSAIKLDHCTQNKDGSLVLSKEEQKKVNKKNRELLNSEVDAPQFISNHIPKDLGHIEWSLFYPFVLEEEFPPLETEVKE